ncbi:uncharacterized protein LOC116852520 [Odontomachus brunneus]|uniref:uncharacterized protein LOC116852520 n=1 Tax=Odontomachus brunneus TaxID=486640 RepID=UPI0013F1F9D4|nr:uncharacterized protein LOC116852520 [Odontomachus brunneus]
MDKFVEPDNRFDHIHVDIIKLPLVREHQYCLTVIDRFSRWPLAVPLKDMRADTVAKALVEHWVCLYGTPLRITSDQGTQFESSVFTSLAQLLGAKHIHTAPYHPQSNGLVERFHRTLKAALMCGAPTPWIDLLPVVLLGLRAAYKDDIQASPAEMLYGTSLRIPGEFFVTTSNPADSTTFAGKLRSLFQVIKPVPASRHSQRNPFAFRDLCSCSHVFRRVDTVKKPLEPPYTGPHKVMGRPNDKTYIILIDGTERAVSADALKPAYLEMNDSAAEPPIANPLQPPASGLSQPPVPKPADPPMPVHKRVSFSSPPGEVTGGEVAVAPQPVRHTHVQGRTQMQPPPSVSRRKQQLQPRQVFAIVP